VASESWLFECKKENVSGGWGSLHSKGIHELCYTPDIIMTIVEAS